MSEVVAAGGGAIGTCAVTHNDPTPAPAAIKPEHVRAVEAAVLLTVGRVENVDLIMLQHQSESESVAVMTVDRCNIYVCNIQAFFCFTEQVNKKEV